MSTEVKRFGVAMTIMDLKLIFVVAFILAMCYQTNVNCFGDDFTVHAVQEFDVGQRELYEFVTMPELVDRWMNWLPYFMAADFKPLSVGKHYLVFANNFEYLLRVADYEEGRFLALESDLMLRPRIELVFNGSRAMGRSELEIRMSFRRTSALFQHTIGRLYRRAIEPKLVESLRRLHRILGRMSRTSGCLDEADPALTKTICSGMRKDLF